MVLHDMRRGYKVGEVVGSMFESSFGPCPHLMSSCKKLWKGNGVGAWCQERIRRCL
jgi:hypothetical protein